MVDKLDRNQTVFTYGRGDQPEVVLVGSDMDNFFVGFFIGGILLLPGASPRALLPALRFGIEKAKALGYGRLEMGILDAHPDARGLSALAKRLGFKPYDCDDTQVFYRLELQ